jgi:hypothetical protein
MENEQMYETAAQYYSLTGKELAKLINVSIATANRRIKVVKNRFSVKKYEKINLYQYWAVFTRGTSPQANPKDADIDLKTLLCR